MADIKPMAITIDDGSVRVPINNLSGEELGVFYFRPTDVGIIERYNSMLDKIDAITEPLAGVDITAEGEAKDEAEMAALKEAERRLYEVLNTMFGGNMAEAFFGKMHPFSPVGGSFYCERAIEAVGEFISRQFDIEAKKMSQKVKKYTAKYSKK